jgi:Resolvase, N terminal domain
VTGFANSSRRLVGCPAAWQPAPRDPGAHRDDDRAETVCGLVEILVGTAAPAPLRRHPRWENIVSAATRPGTGGRRKRVDVGFEIEATRELRERYEEIAHRGSRLLIWQMDPDGILAARLSGQDVQKGATLMGQIHGGVALAATHGIKPACAVVAMRTGGAAEYARRLDFIFIRDRIAAGGLQWVGYRGSDRVARDQLSAYSLYNFLEAANTDLYLGRSVDWSSQNDKLMIGTLGVIGEFERGIIRERTHTATNRASSTPAAVTRLQTDQHPPQRPDVPRAGPRAMALLRPSQRDVRPAQARRRHEHPPARCVFTEKLGFPISRDRIRLILKDPFYVTGEAHVTYQGVVYPLRPIKLVIPSRPRSSNATNRSWPPSGDANARTRSGTSCSTASSTTPASTTSPTTACRSGSEARTRSTPTTSAARSPNAGDSPSRTRRSTRHRRRTVRLCEDPDLQRRYQQRAVADTANPPAGVLPPSQQGSHEARITDLNRQREQIQATGSAKAQTSILATCRNFRARLKVRRAGGVGGWGGVRSPRAAGLRRIL